jgi:hypothetical protein
MADSFRELVARVRDHYVGQFDDFVEEQKKKCTVGTSELKVGFNGQSELYGNAYCVDFASNDGEFKVVELIPDRYLSFNRRIADYGDLTIQVDDLRWDDIVLQHDVDALSPDAVQTWFDRWYGPDDRQTNMIHSLLIKPRYMSIDLGTAPAEALFEMIDLLKRAGAKTLQIEAGRNKIVN